ncbi:MAG: F0F1 ATP synthase subunit A [Oscillospiraceae bacterium]|nr:F0F1 ATP synthase subunit A [Oscillospiraceae bacterium]
MSGMEVKGARILFYIGGLAVTETVISLLAVTLLLSVCGILLGRNLKKRPGAMQVLTEKGVGMLMNIVSSTMGEHNLSWVPYIGTIFLSSFFGSLIGLTGFLRSTTADLAVVLTWAVMTSVVIWCQSIKRNGFLGWLKGFTEPIVVMTPMNLISEIAQPMAMAFRHFGNVAGGGIITTIVYTALALGSNALLGALAKTVFLPLVLIALAVMLLVVGYRKKKLAAKIFGFIFAVLGLLGLAMHFELLGGVEVPILQLGIPAVLSVYFDIFSGFVQAFVFCLLSMVYIGGVCPPPEEVKNK